ncbi:MAG: hypothetical protein N2512_00295, partial [Armatimonadetes bacterium]|nr:hypothetical protein [Armatimonadota bacterium]
HPKSLWGAPTCPPPALLHRARYKPSPAARNLSSLNLSAHPEGLPDSLKEAGAKVAFLAPRRERR